MLKSLQELLALLRAIQWHAWASHWVAKGENYYADHLLFERIYTGGGGAPINDQIDGLGERMVSEFGVSCIDSASLGQRSADMISAAKAKQSTALAQAFYLEQQLQLLIRDLLKTLTPDQVVWDNFLRSTSDQRSEVYYLLKQRLGGRV